MGRISLISYFLCLILYFLLVCTLSTAIASHTFDSSLDYQTSADIIQENEHRQQSITHHPNQRHSRVIESKNNEEEFSLKLQSRMYSNPRTPRELVQYIFNWAIWIFSSKTVTSYTLQKSYIMQGIPPNVVIAVTDNFYQTCPSHLKHLVNVFRQKGIDSNVMKTAIHLPNDFFRNTVPSKNINVKREPSRIIRVPSMYPSKLLDTTSSNQISTPSSDPPTRQYRTTPSDSNMISRAVTGDNTLRNLKTRIDNLPGRLSVGAEEMPAILHIMFPRSEYPLDGTCMLDSNSNYPSLKLYIEAWCLQLIGWISYSIPTIGALYQNTAFSIILRKELVCETVSSVIFNEPETIYNNEILWGRVVDSGQIPFPANLNELLQSWSRIAIVQSRRISNIFRDYIVSQYILSVPEGVAFLSANPSVCEIESVLLQQADKLKNKNIQIFWPSRFALSTTFEAMLPICLGVYPMDTDIEYDVKGTTNKRYRISCSVPHGFICVNC